METKDRVQTIIETLKSDFESGFRLLFLHYHSSLVRLSSQMIDNRFVEDTVQDVFVGIWNNRVVFDNSIAMRAYLYGAVKNKCISVLRKKGYEDKYINQLEQSKFLDYIIDEDMFMQLHSALDTLPAHYRKAMRMTMQGEKIADIAKILNVSEDAVKAYKRRAKEMLKSRLEDVVQLAVILGGM